MRDASRGRLLAVRSLIDQVNNRSRDRGKVVLGESGAVWAEFGILDGRREFGDDTHVSGTSISIPILRKPLRAFGAFLRMCR